MKKKLYVITIMATALIFMFCGCGKTQSNNDSTKTNSEESTKENEIEDSTPTSIISRDGSRDNPFGVGEGGSVKFFGYGIQDYGTIDYSVKEYNGKEVTFKYTLHEYGKSNPLVFNNKYDIHNYENNCMLNVFSVDDISTFTISNDVESILPMKRVKIGKEQTKEVKYKVGDTKYLALVYYTLQKDGGDKDFIDNNGLYGHIIFYDLSIKA